MFGGDRSTVIVLAAVYVFAGVMLLFVGNWTLPGPSRCGEWGCRVFTLFLELQTLFAAGIALIAAWWAALPVWKQLQKMNVQQDLNARNIILERLKGIERRFQKAGTAVTKVLNDLDATAFSYLENERIYSRDMIRGPSAEYYSKQVLLTLSLLRSQKKKLEDTEAIDVSRDYLIKRLEHIGDLLDSAYAYDRLQGDWEISVSQLEEIAAMGEEARDEFPDALDQAQEANRTMTRVAKQEINRIRQRIRTIDDHILTPPT